MSTESTTASRKIVLAIGLLRRYRDRREDDLNMAKSVPSTATTDAIERSIINGERDVADLTEAIEHLSTLTLGDLTN